MVSYCGLFYDKSSHTDTNSENEVCGGSSMSPTKRVALHTQCIEQLEWWHQLMEKGGISKKQYDPLQCNILAEIKHTCAKLTLSTIRHPLRTVFTTYTI